MQADEVGRPFHRDGWVYEEKYDGWRVVAYKDGTAVRLVSRAGKDHSRRFAELAAAIRALPPATLILDGEVAIFDEQLISRFEWFRKRPEMSPPRRRSTWPSTASTSKAVTCGRSRSASAENNQRLSWRERPQLLFPTRRLAANGLEAWKQVIERGYEGLVAKDAASAYKGGRTLSWLKVRQPKYREIERGFYKT